jgi:molecular chaperone GrpE (heat shock protein)
VSKQQNPKKENQTSTVPPSTVEGILNNSNQAELDALTVQYNELQTKVSELENKNLRLHADIDNIQKQHIIETNAARKSGKRTLAMSVAELINTIKSILFICSGGD